MAKRADAQDRRARAAQVQAEHNRAERRRTFTIVGGAVAVSAVILAWVVVAVVGQQREQDEVSTAAEKSVDGVKEFKDLTQNHVETPVDYPETPSVGGDHSQVWLNCGVYTDEVNPMQATHSLEHGAVWIGYDPELESSEIDALTELAETNSYVVLSPVGGVPSPITVSAWGAQLQLDGADDPRLEVFLTKYQQGPQTPEPGAPCTGGAGGV